MSTPNPSEARTTVDALKHILVGIKGDARLFDRVSERADLVEEIGLDSLELLRFMLEIEASLALAIDFDKLDYSALRSLDVLAGFLDTMPRRPSSGDRVG